MKRLSTLLLLFVLTYLHATAQPLQKPADTKLTDASADTDESTVREPSEGAIQLTPELEMLAAKVVRMQTIVGDTRFAVIIAELARLRKEVKYTKEETEAWEDSEEKPEDTPLEDESDASPQHEYTWGFSSHFMYYGLGSEVRLPVVGMLCKGEQCTRRPYVVAALIAVAFVWCVVGVARAATWLVGICHEPATWLVGICHELYVVLNALDAVPKKKEPRDMVTIPKSAEVVQEDTHVVLSVRPEIEAEEGEKASVLDTPDEVPIAAESQTVVVDLSDLATDDKNLVKSGSSDDSATMVGLDGFLKLDCWPEEQCAALRLAAATQELNEVTPVPEVEAVHCSSSSPTGSDKENEGVDRIDCYPLPSKSLTYPPAEQGCLDTIMEDADVEDMDADMEEDIFDEDCFNVGTQVKCQFSGEWIDATITNIVNGIYTARIDPGDYADANQISGTEAPVASSRLRLNRPSFKVQKRTELEWSLSPVHPLSAGYSIE